MTTYPNLLLNPGAEDPGLGAGNAFVDPFTPVANLSAWTAFSGSWSVASNLVSRVVDGVQKFGHREWWDVSAGTRIRFKWVTGGTFIWYVRFVDDGSGSNVVRFTLDGASISLSQTVNGVPTTIYSSACVLTNGNFYWLQPTITGTSYTATVDNDSAGAPGANVHTMPSQTVSVFPTARMAVGLFGAGMQMGGAFGNVCRVMTPMPPNWFIGENAPDYPSAFCLSKTTVKSGLYSLSTYNNDANASGYWLQQPTDSLSEHEHSAFYKAEGLSNISQLITHTGPTDFQYLYPPAATFDWTRLSLASSNANPYSALYITSQSGYIWFDDVSIRRIGSSLIGAKNNTLRYRAEKN